MQDSGYEFPRIYLLRLSEKGTSNALLVDLADIRRMKWTERPLFVDPQSYAISVFEAFRTVSLGILVNRGDEAAS